MKPLPVFGRDDEIQFLRRSLRGNAAGSVVVGDRGSGKSALVAEVARLVSETSLFVTASHEARPTPLGAFASALGSPLPQSASQTELLAHALTVIRRRPCDRELVVTDDVELLDPLSATLIDQLLRSDDIALLCTAGTTARLPRWLAKHLQQRSLMQCEIGPLTPSALRESIDVRLLGGATPRAHVEIFRLSQGNPAIAHQLVSDAVEAGTLIEGDGTWTMVAPFPIQKLVAATIDEQLAGCSDEVRMVVELCALAGSAELDMIESLCDLNAIEEAEKRGFIAIGSSSGRAESRVADPLVAQYLQQSISLCRQRRISRGLADWISQRGARRSDDALRVSVWDLRGGSIRWPEGLLIGAQRALDLEQLDVAAGLAKAAAGEGGGFETHFLLGRALTEQGLFVEADAALSVADQAVANELDRARVVVARCALLLRSQLDIDGALRLVVSVIEQTSMNEALEMLEVERARLELSAGSPDRALALAESLAAVTQSNDAHSVRALIVARALRATGQSADALEVIHQSLSAPSAESSERRTAHRELGLLEVDVLIDSGKMSQARKKIGIEFDRACEHDEWYFAALWQSRRATLEAWAGRVTTAVGLLERALHSVGGQDRLSMAPTLLGELALVTAQGGRIDEARHHLSSVPTAAFGASFELEVVAERVWSWILAHTGQPEAATQAAIDTAAEALRHGHRRLAACSLHDVVRFGHGHLAVQPLGDLVAELGGAWPCSLYERHARASATLDHKALHEIALDYVQVGAVTLAAESATQAADAAAGKRHLRARHGYQALVDTLLVDRSPGTTPLLKNREALLTHRQSEIARLSVDHTNIEIAARLSISRRTVENHLNTVFHLLEIHTRDDLGELVHSDDRDWA